MNFRICILHLVVFASFTAVFYFSTYQDAQLVVFKDGVLRFSDLSHYFWSVQGFWFDSHHNIYDLQSHLELLSLAAGRRVNEAMPMGITPTALLIFFPFASVAEFSLKFAHALWMGFSFTLLFNGVNAVAKTVSSKNAALRLRVFLVNLILLLSYTAVVVIALGQTSIMAAGALLLLVTNSSSAKSAQRRIAISALLMLCLSVKAPYLILGALTLIALQRWRDLFCSGLVITAVLAALTPQLGIAWPLDYYREVLHFSDPNIPAVYQRAIAVDMMNIFRSAFRGFIGDGMAIKVSSITFILGYALLIICSLRIPKLARAFPLKQISALNIFQYLILSLGIYLLFAPYSGAYEDVLLIAALNLLLLAQPRMLQPNVRLLFLLVTLSFLLSRQLILPSAPIWIFWCLKLLVLAAMLKFARTATSTAQHTPISR